MTKMIPPKEFAPVQTGNDRPAFDLSRAAHWPVSAFDNLDRLKPDRPRIARTTVSRGLEHLIRAGRVQARDAGAEVGRITKALAKEGFRPTTHPVVGVHGRCSESNGPQRAGGKA